MRLSMNALVPLTAVLALLGRASVAAACGGCLHVPAVHESESSVVIGHKMIFSISKLQTTLWDEISYSGAPKDFAWVLPIKGKVEVGLSSDILFKSLEQVTAASVESPPVECAAPPYCIDSNVRLDSGGGYSFSGNEDLSPVTVIASETVGPYETVQLHASDPGALEAWLAEHDYVIPDDIAPVIGAYVSEGFDFLAMRLAPGAGTRAMRPVRVTVPGASFSLPLRMVAAGTGAVTPITLWVIGEGRYEPVGMPWFTIDPAAILWNWESSSSNYAALRHAAVADSGGMGWLIEAAEPLYLSSLRAPIEAVLMSDPSSSGYATLGGPSAADLADEDILTLAGGGFDGGYWVTRLHGELSRAALAADLVVSASLDQSTLQRRFRAKVAVGAPPGCPPYPDTCAFTAPFRPFSPYRATMPPISPSAGCAIGERAPTAGEQSYLLLAAALAIALRRASRSGHR